MRAVRRIIDLVLRIRGRSPAAVVVVAVMLSGCGTVVERDGPGRRVPAGSIEDAVPRDEPQSKYGNPDSYVVNGKRYYTMKTARGHVEKGIASWYGRKFHGRRTSSGETYDMYQMTAAHKGLPLPTYVEVRNLDNGRTAVVKVNDRGPFHGNRIIDLSYAAALKLGMADKGTAFVEVRALDGRGGRAAPVTAAAPAPTTAAPAARSPAIAGAQGVYLQVGAFRDRNNAVRLYEQVGSVIERSVHIQEVSSNGNPLYRVQVGPIVSVDIADTIVGMLEQLGITQHHFVTN